MQNASLPSSASIKNVETINIYNDGAAFTTGGTTVDASKFVGATAINQIGLAADVTNLADGTTAGFKGITTTTAALQVTAADAATSAAVALTDVKDDAGLTVLSSATGTLNTVTVTGNVVDSGTNGIDKIALNVTGGKDVQSLTINSAVGANLGVSTNGTGKAVTAINAAGSTGALTFNLNSTSAPTAVGSNTDVATLTTGSGNDIVGLATALSATVTAASVTTGAGNDTLFVQVDDGSAVAGSTVAVDAGDGNDTINLTIGTSANVAYNVQAGAGNDTVVISGTVKTTDKIDGGAGIDTVSLDVGGTGALVADNYIVFNKVLTNFETLQLNTTAVTNFDGSQLAANYTTIDLADGSIATKIGAAQALVANGDLTATAAGYDAAATPKAYGGTLNITEKVGDGGSTNGTITAEADTVNLTVDGGTAANSTAVSAVLAGDVKTANIILNPHTDTSGTTNAFVASSITVDNTSTLSAMTSLTLSGNGAATVTNAGSKLVNIDASGLTNADIKGAVSGLVALDYTSTNTAAETIKLGAGLDTLHLNASTYGAVDTVSGLNLVTDATGAIDTAKSDVLHVGGIVTATTIGKFTTSQTDLDLALKDAATFSAANGNEALVFQQGGDTYVFKDAGTTGQIDAADTVVKLVGTVNLDALIASLHA